MSTQISGNFTQLFSGSLEGETASKESGLFDQGALLEQNNRRSVELKVVDYLPL